MKAKPPKGPEKRQRQTLAQKAYRKRLKEAGYIRLEINIPPELFKRLKPHLQHFHNGAFTGKAIVNLLNDIEFK